MRYLNSMVEWITPLLVWITVMVRRLIADSRTVFHVFCYYFAVMDAEYFTPVGCSSFSDRSCIVVYCINDL